LVAALEGSDVLRARLTHPLIRKVMRGNTIRNLLGPITEGSALTPTTESTPMIDLMVATDRASRLEQVFENISRQTYPRIRLVLVEHGVALDRGEVRERSQEAGIETDVVSVDEDVVLGEVFNIGFAATGADIIGKMDNDDFYGPEYLWDLLSALDFSGADVAGKWAHYAYQSGIDSMIYRFVNYEHRYTEVLAISTLLMRRSVLDQARFPDIPNGSGSAFLWEIGAMGGRLYAADRWNYIYLRGQDGASSTFPVPESDLIANSEVVRRGVDYGEVVV